MFNKSLIFINKIKDVLEIFLNKDFKDTVNHIYEVDVLLYCHDSNRGLDLRNRAYSPLLDSLRDEFEAQGYSCITIAAPISKLTGDIGYGNPISINRKAIISYGLNSILKYVKIHPLIKFYETIFNKAKPKFIISIGCNDEFCEAARNLDIFHAELLHGIGYKPIPWGWDKKKAKNLPQCILSLDDVSTDTFLELSKKSIIIKQIPHPFLKRFHKSKKALIPKEWLPNNPQVCYQKEILVSLQWGYCYEIDGIDFFKDIIENGLLPKELEEAIKIAPLDILWRFRLHPVILRQPIKYKKLITYIEYLVNSYPNCELHESTSLPLPSVLSSCSGHITLSSMVSYEAAYMGVPTLALCPTLRCNDSPYYSMFDDLVRARYLIKKEPNRDFIVNWIQTITKKDMLLSSSNTQENLLEWLIEQSS